MFRKAGFPVRLEHRSTTLRQLLSPRREQAPCIKPECRTKERNLCYKKDVGYKITCSGHSNFYIGSTIRRLRERIREHTTQSTSSIYRRLKKCQNNDTDSNNNTNITMEFVCGVNDPVNLQFKEAIHIKQKRPQINSREKCNELGELLFRIVPT